MGEFKNYIFLIGFLVVLSLYQGCSEEPFRSKQSTSSVNSNSDSTATAPNEDNQLPPQIEYISKNVSVGVGRGGAIITSEDGFQSLIHIEQTLIPGQDYPSPSLPQDCRYGSFEPYVPDHDPHMFRGVTFGNNKFVAVGGCCYANVKTSLDGVNWSSEIKVDMQNVTYGGCPWAGDVTFGKGVFVAFGGGTSMWSADGENWQRVSWKDDNRISGGYRRVEFENGAFIAVGSDPAPVLKSFDGINWQSDTRVEAGIKMASGAQVVLVNSKINPNQLSVYDTTSDSWSDGFTFPASISSIVYIKETHKFFVKAGSYNYQSDDGILWTEMGTSPYAILGYSQGTFYTLKKSWGVTASTTRITSSDGLNWTNEEQHTPFNPIIDAISAEIKVPK